MNTADASSTNENFNLISFLAADLQRAQVVLHGQANQISSLRLCLGAFSPRFLPVLLCRLAHWMFLLKLGGVGKLFSLINFFFFGIEIAIRCPIGKGLFLPHTQGTVIGAWAIGTDVTIFQGVTLGAKEIDFSYIENSRPTVGNAVTIGSGAKVLGGLVLGNNSRIGANAVVLASVPDNCLAVGIPAKIITVKD